MEFLSAFVYARKYKLDMYTMMSEVKIGLLANIQDGYTQLCCDAMELTRKKLMGLESSGYRCEETTAALTAIVELQAQAEMQAYRLLVIEEKLITPLKNAIERICDNCATAWGSEEKGVDFAKENYGLVFGVKI